jgi:hypothetical protein
MPTLPLGEAREALQRRAEELNRIVVGTQGVRDTIG